MVEFAALIYAACCVFPPGWPLPTLEATKRPPKGSRAIVTRQPRSSALFNKVLTNKELLPTSEHKLYSLRHTFEDRLTAVEAPEEAIAPLMGRKCVRPKYAPHHPWRRSACVASKNRLDSTREYQTDGNVGFIVFLFVICQLALRTI